MNMRQHSQPQHLAPKTKQSSRSFSGNEDIHTYSKEGNLTKVQDLITHHSSTVNARDGLSSTPLHYAAEHGHLPLVKFLSSQRAFKNNRNSSGMTPLLNAVASGHLDVVKYLVGEGAFTFVLDNEGNGPLHVAAKHSRPRVLEWLLSNENIDKSLRNSKGEMYSAYLISQGASSDSSSSVGRGGADIKHRNTVLQWRLVCTEKNIRQEKLAVLADLDLSTWQTFCFSLLTRFSIAGITNYLVKDKDIKKFLVKNNDAIFSAIPALVEYLVLMEHDGDEGSGHVKDLPKFYKILNKIYRPDDNMTFEIKLNGDILHNCQNTFRKNSDGQSLKIGTISPNPESPRDPATSEIGSTTAEDCDKEVADQSDSRPSPLSTCNSRTIRESNRRLHASCVDGNLSSAQHALSQHAEVNSRDDALCTPLHIASQHGHLKLCQLLVEAKTFKNNRNSSGMTPLLNAVASGHLDVVKYLVGEGAFTFVLDNEGNGPLHLAAKNKQPKIIDWLLRNCDIDIGIADNLGQTYSYYLEKKPKLLSNNMTAPHEVLAEKLAKNSFSATNNSESQLPKRSPASSAVPKPMPEAGSSALSHRTEACVKSCLHGDFAVARQFLEEGVNVDGREQGTEMTLLHISCQAGEADFVQSLLEAGAQVNVRDVKGNTPLHCAALGCHLEILTLLETWNAQILGNESGSTPLHEACAANNVDVVKMLMSMGGSVGDIDYAGNSALHCVVGSHNTTLCLWMCKQQGADEIVHVVNAEGLSPYDLARNSGQIDVCTVLHQIAEDRKIRQAISFNSERLLKECVSGNWTAANVLMNTFTGPNVIDLDWLHEESGKQAVHICAEGGDIACVSTLISLGADVNVVDLTENRLTALHYACAGGHVDMVTQLLEHGANANAEDQAGCTPLFHACTHDFYEIGCLMVENYDVDLNHVNWKSLDSILHLACKLGSLNWIKLIESYSGLSVLSELKNKNGMSPLEVAVASNRSNVILYAKESLAERKLGNVRKCAQALCSGDLHTALDLSKAGISPNSPLSQTQETPHDASPPTLFHLACEKGDIHIVKEFVAQGGSVSLKDSRGLTALHFACMGFRPASILYMKEDSDQNEKSEVEFQSRQLEIVRWLKKSNANIDAQDVEGMTSLHLACLYGNVVLAQWLIDRGADVHMVASAGRGVIHLACESGNTQLVKWLLQDMKVIDTGFGSSSSISVLMKHSAKSGNMELLAWLYHTMGVDRTIYTRSKQTAMEIKLRCLIRHQEKKFRQASSEDNINLMEVILSMSDMPVDLNSHEPSPVSRWFTESWVDDTTGDTALHKACRFQQVGAVQFLLNKMADVDSVNENGITPLHLASLSGNGTIFDLLLESGADVNILDKEGNSVLHFSCILPENRVVERIADCYPQFSEFRPNLKGISPFRVASDEGNIPLVLFFAEHPWIYRQEKKLIEATLSKNDREIQSLMDAGISVNVYSQDSYRRTPLHIATSQGNIKNIKLLLAAGAKIEALDSSNRNSLHVAASYGAVEVVKLLLEQFPPFSCLENSNPEEQTNTDFVMQAVDELGMTPFAHACLNGQMITAAYLIGQGACLANQDIYGSSVLHLACKSRNISLVQWLIEGFDMDISALNFYKQSPLDIAIDADDEDMCVFLTSRLEAARLKEEQALLDRQEAERRQEILHIEEMAHEQEESRNRWETEVREQQTQSASRDAAKQMLQLVMKDSLCKACEEGSWVAVQDILTCDINPNILLNEEGRSGLHISAFCGFVDIVDSFLKISGVDIDMFDFHEMTALHIACMKEDVECIEALMCAGADPLAAQTIESQSAIDVLCESDKSLLLRVILSNSSRSTLDRIQDALTKRNKSRNGIGKSIVDKMIDFNSCACMEAFFEFVNPLSHMLEISDSVGKTSLSAAASSGNLPIVEMLLAFNLDVDSKDSHGLTPLMNAVLCLSLDIVKVLVAAGASIFEVDTRGNTPLHLCGDDSIDIAVWLIKKGADFYCENADGQSPLNLAESKHNYVLARQLKNNQNNVLEVLDVCQSGDVEWMRSLLARKVDIQRSNKEKVSGLHIASFHNHTDMCQFLVAEGLIIDSEDSEGRTAVHYACMGGNVDVLQTLVQLGASLFRQNTVGEGCLHFIVNADMENSTSSNFLKCLVWLVDEKHLSVDTCSDDGTSVLMAAAGSGNIPALEFLHNHGASVLQNNVSGCNSFHLAVQRENTTAAGWLLEHYSEDISVNTPDVNERTAFMIACEEGLMGSAEWLYDHGCDFKQLGSSTDAGDSPLHAACRRGDQVLCEWLLQHAGNLSLLNSKGESPVDVARINNFNNLVAWLEDNKSTTAESSAVLQHELELSLNLKVPCAKLVETLFGELFAVYLQSAKDDENDGTTDSFELASFLFNTSATTGNLDSMRDLIFNTEHLISSREQAHHSDFFIDIVNVQSPLDGRTPLFNAVLGGHLRVAQFLLTHGARCNLPDHSGRNALNVAQGRKDREEMYELLLSSALDEDLRAPAAEVSDADLYFNHWAHEDDNSVASLQLMKFCFLGEGHFDKVVQVIEDFGADVNYESSHGLSPLLLAANENHINLVRYLIDGGADINHVDRNNASSLILACRNQNRALASFLINNRADLTVVDSKTGDTALHIMCRNDMVELMEDIVNLPRSVLRHLNLKVTNALNGYNLLHYAILANSLSMVTLLLQQGLDVNACNEVDNLNSPLQYACLALHEPLVEFLLSHEALARVANRLGVTPLATVLHLNDLNLARILHEHGADITECEVGTDDSFLHTACREGRVETAKWLMREGLDPDTENAAGETATKLAHASGSEDLLEWILAWILSTQLRRPVEEVLAEAHALPFSPAERFSRPESDSFLPTVVELEQQEDCREASEEMLEFDD